MDPAISRKGAQAPDADEEQGIVTSYGGEDVARGEHVRVGVEEALEAGTLLPEAVCETSQCNLRMVIASVAPGGQVVDAEGYTKQAVVGVVQDVGMTASLGHVAQELPVRLKRIALLTQTLVDHGASGLDSSPDGGAGVVLHRNGVVVLVQVSGYEVVTTRVKDLSVPHLADEGIEELRLLEDGGAAKPGAASQAPGPLVGNPGGSAATTAAEEKLGTCKIEGVKIVISL